MSTHYVTYQVTYPREMTSVNHCIAFTETEGKIFLIHHLTNVAGAF